MHVVARLGARKYKFREDASLRRWVRWSRVTPVTLVCGDNARRSRGAPTESGSCFVVHFGGQLTVRPSFSCVALNEKLLKSCRFLAVFDSNYKNRRPTDQMSSWCGHCTTVWCKDVRPLHLSIPGVRQRYPWTHCTLLCMLGFLQFIIHRGAVGFSAMLSFIHEL